MHSAFLSLPPLKISGMAQNILVLGASGQIGTELVEKLRTLYGNDHVVASDIKEHPSAVLKQGPYETINALDRNRIEEVVAKYNITQVYHLVAMLSATAEKNPIAGWNLNMNTLFHLLEMAREKKIEKLYWPSSIAAFGPNTPVENTPQYTVMDPTTIYGISKLSGELLCQWYHQNHGVDVRSIRYPGLISYKTVPGGGTTDYAVDIFFKAKAEGVYTCFLSEERALPMMYMEDAIKATVGIMEAPAESVKNRTSYNLASLSFTPKQLARAIQKHLPDFQINYEPDFRDKIAANWPQSIDDTEARKDWGWQHDYDLDTMVEDMLKNIPEAKVNA